MKHICREVTEVITIFLLLLPDSWTNPSWWNSYIRISVFWKVMKYYKPTMKLQHTVWILELRSSFIYYSKAFVQHMTAMYSLRVHHQFWWTCVSVLSGPMKGLQGPLKDDLPLSEKSKLASWLSQCQRSLNTTCLKRKKPYFVRAAFFLAVKLCHCICKNYKVFIHVIVNDVQNISVKGKESKTDRILHERNLKSALNGGQPSMIIQWCFPKSKAPH